MKRFVLVRHSKGILNDDLFVVAKDTRMKICFCGDCPAPILQGRSVLCLRKVETKCFILTRCLPLDQI